MKTFLFKSTTIILIILLILGVATSCVNVTEPNTPFEPIGTQEEITNDLPPVHTVTFVDYNGTILKVEEIGDGKSAFAPEDPIRVGYAFVGWDKPYNKITANTTITAIYKIEDNQICINYSRHDEGKITAKFSVHGNVNMSLLELQLDLKLENASYDGYQMLTDGLSEANCVDGVFYFSFIANDDITTDTNLFNITFTTMGENVDIVLDLIDSVVSDSSFTNVTKATIVGTTYSN